MPVQKAFSQGDVRGSFNLQGVQKTFIWDIAPASWRMIDEQRLEIRSTPKSDLFVDPEGGYQVLNSPRALIGTDPVFQFSALVEVDFGSDYDAGALVLYKDDNHWAKLCFEFSPAREPMIVSVVNREVSDDSNATGIQGDRIYLRISRLLHSYAFHSSVDGKKWDFVRYFSFSDMENFRVGLSAQSPTGETCRVVFSNVQYTTDKLGDLRNGE